MPLSLPVHCNRNRSTCPARNIFWWFWERRRSLMPVSPISPNIVTDTAASVLAFHSSPVVTVTSYATTETQSDDNHMSGNSTSLIRVIRRRSFSCCVLFHCITSVCTTAWLWCLAMLAESRERKYVFRNRVVDKWNALPDSCMDHTTLNES